MRIAPLIPLIVLAAGALLVEALRLEGELAEQVDALLEVSDAEVTHGSEHTSITFSADTFSLTQAGAKANNVRGALTTPTGRHTFSSALVRQSRGTPALELSGNVRLRHADLELRTEQLKISFAGDLTGTAVTIKGNNRHMRAEAFALTANGTLRLHENVHWTFRQ